jgi:Flp pilus assembly protein TadG
LLSDDTGSASVAFVLIVVTLVVVIGLVVDSAGKYQMAEQAQQVASSAARAATNSISGDTVRVGELTMDPEKAVQAGQAYIAAAGMEGTVTVNGQVVTVEVTTTYSTRFLSLIGITSLPASGQAAAQLITN